jgi:hypothetical protein
MKRHTRIFASALAPFAIALASPASAGQGNSVVESKQLADGIVVLSGSSYRVSDGTAIEDVSGKTIALADLPTLAQGASNDDAAVYYEASDGDVTTPVLHRLKLTGSVPD